MYLPVIYAMRSLCLNMLQKSARSDMESEAWQLPGRFGQILLSGARPDTIIVVSILLRTAAIPD